VTCTALDPSGNTNSCAFFVTIEDILPPDFNSNPVIDACDVLPITLTTDPGICSATFTFEKPTAMDSCCTSPVPVSVSAIDEGGFIIQLTEFTSNSLVYVTGQFPQSCLGSNVITSTANDGRGNSAQQQCAVLVFDNEPPSITCSNNQIAACTNGPVFYEEPVASDNCTNLTVTCTPPNGSLLAVGIYNVTCIADDGCGGNSNSCSFTVNVVDITPPTISCPSNVVTVCGQPTDPSSTGTATASDDCDFNPSVTFTDATSGFCPTVIYRTWFAVDAGGNTNQCTQVITTQDTTAPTISCPADKQLQCGDSTATNNTGAATASDACGPVTITYYDQAMPVNCTGKAGINRYWIAVDGCNNSTYCVQKITFVDTTAPVITCPADKQLQCGASTATNNTGAATASDACGPVAITYTDVATAANCSGKAGINRTWKATDGCGNFSTCVQQITFVDTTAPVITCPADKQLQCGDSTAPSNTGTATAASDNCGGPVTITYTDAATPANCTSKAGIDRTWKATDGCGNFSTCVQKITFVDTTPPIVTVPAGGDLGCSPTNLPTDVSLKALVTATDNCSTTSVTVTHVDTNINCTVTSTFTVTVKDDCNNTTTKTVVYTYGCLPCVPFQFNFQGNTTLSGTVANVRTFVTNGVSVRVSAFSRTKPGAWATAYLGSYVGGLGVTDSSEGNGNNDRHAVDNIVRDNYVLFEFSKPVVLSKAFLGYVKTDSDLKLWIGTFTDPFNNHLSLSDAVLTSFGYSETNMTSTNATRWANLNAGATVGNAIVIAALPQVTETNDQFKIALFDLCIQQCTPLALGCAASTGTKGVAYSSALVASGGTPSYTFTINSGSLPLGLTLNATTGAITGTPTTAGTYTYVAKVTDSTGATALTSSCTITIATPLTLGCVVANSGQVGVAYSSAAIASGGIPPYTFSLYSGSVPPGLTGDPSAGTLYGTPTTAGTYTYVGKVTDSTGATALSSSCTITIAAPLTLGCAASTGTKGVAYSSTLVRSGGTAPFTFTINSGSLPPGLSLNATTGAITGTPTTAGTYTYVAKVTDSTGATKLTSSCTITIAAPPLTLGCAANKGTKGAAYSSALVASGGTPAYTFTKNSGSLPPGLTLNASTGAITGTPTTAGTYTYVAKVTDSTGATKLTSSCTITIAASMTLGCPASTGKKGYSYSSTLVRSGGTSPYTFSIYSGSLPPGLTLNTTTGAITGKPTSTGTYSFTAKVTDAVGATALSSGCSIKISL
jgi:hypothetical protein